MLISTSFIPQTELFFFLNSGLKSCIILSVFYINIFPIQICVEELAFYSFWHSVIV